MNIPFLDLWESNPSGKAQYRTIKDEVLPAIR